ncbi:MAG: GspH/FimT family pseudopilin [Magnetococcales bacterium]|nr:GspH/FimT family pseudopilin [Magnetococcales bacterium]
MSQCKNSGGFTIIELILAIVLVGILSVIAVARWPGVGISIYSYRENLAHDINLARAMALSRGESVTIQNSTNHDSYLITDSSGSVVKTSTPLTGLTIYTFIVVFDPYGDPGLQDSDIGLELEGNTTALRVVGESGAVVFL